MKRVLICVWGPELGCLMRELHIAERLSATGDFELSFYCHQRHIGVVQNVLGLDTDIHAYKRTLRIGYCPRFDLMPAQTILAAARFAAKGLVSEYSAFKGLVGQVRPSFVINDFLPQVSAYAEILGVPCIGVQNYVCPKVEWDNSGMDVLFLLGFRCSYGLHNHNLVETFFPDRLPGVSGTTWTSPVARTRDRTKGAVRRELGVRRGEKLVFMALGGAGTNLEYLEEIHRTAREYPDIKMLLLPRGGAEAGQFLARFPEFVHTRRVVYDTHNYTGNSDLVVSKCGFRTVTEALKNGVALLPFHTPNHPEIRLTENLLLRHGFSEGLVLKTDTAQTFWRKVADAVEGPVPGRPALTCNGDREMSEFLAQCPDRIPEKARQK